LVNSGGAVGREEWGTRQGVHKLPTSPLAAILADHSMRDSVALNADGGYYV